MSVVLDTHVLVWWTSEPDRLTPRMREKLASCGPQAPVQVPDIVLWEVAMLVSLGRLRLARPLRDWLEAATAPPLVACVPINAAIAAEVAALPATFHRDPADRLIVATARVLGLPLLTMDARIRDSGVVEVIS